MRNTEDRHETRLKSMNSTIDNVRALMIIQEDYICWLEKQVEALTIIQEDYICWLEKQVEALSGMCMGDYFKEHPRE